LLEASVDVPPDVIGESLARLRSAEFLYEIQLFPEIEYTFKHALTHEVTYGAILHERRRGLHSSIAGAIQRLYADRLAEHVDQLAQGSTMAPGVDRSSRDPEADRLSKELRDAQDELNKANAEVDRYKQRIKDDENGIANLKAEGKSHSKEMKHLKSDLKFANDTLDKKLRPAAKRASQKIDKLSGGPARRPRGSGGSTVPP
jgi:hypothetical protein